MHMSVENAVLTRRISKVNIKIESLPPHRPIMAFIQSIRLIPVETITASVFVKYKKNNVFYSSTSSRVCACVCVQTSLGFRVCHKLLFVGVVCIN